MHNDAHAHDVRPYLPRRKQAMPSRKDSPPDTVPQRRRFLIAAGTSDLRVSSEDAQLPSVEQDLERIRTLFCEPLHYENALPDLKINPKREIFREALRDWIRKKDRSESDVVVIYYSGHGDIEERSTLPPDLRSDPEDSLDTAIPTRTWPARRKLVGPLGIDPHRHLRCWTADRATSRRSFPASRVCSQSKTSVSLSSRGPSQRGGTSGCVRRGVDKRFE